MDSENQKDSTPHNSGDPGRTPGSAEGDLETVEEDLKEKNLESDSQNYEKTKDKKVAESATGSDQ